MNAIVIGAMCICVRVRDSHRFHTGTWNSRRYVFRPMAKGFPNCCCNVHRIRVLGRRRLALCTCAMLASYTLSRYTFLGANIRVNGSLHSELGPSAKWMRGPAAKGASLTGYSKRIGHVNNNIWHLTPFPKLIKFRISTGSLIYRDNISRRTVYAIL